MRPSDSLLPVLLLTTTVLASGGVLEAYARSREAGALRIAVAAETAPPGSAADATDELADEPDPDAAEPVSPEHAEARALARRGETERALQLFTELVARDPSALGPRLDLGYWLRRSDRVAESLAVLERSVALSPDSPAVVLQLAVSQRAAGKLENAEASYRRALQLRPNHNRTLLALAWFLKARGKLPEALGLFEKAASAGDNAERAGANLALGRARLMAGRIEPARAAFKAAVELMPGDASLRLSIAKACVNSAKKELLAEAREHAERAALLAPDRALVIGLLGWVRERSGDREGARAAYQLALQIDPDQDYAERKLLHLDLTAQDLRSARRHAEHLVARQPESAEHHFLLALVASREGKLDDAKQHYESAIEKAKGQYPEAYFNLGRLQRSAGNLEASLAAYRKAIELKPDYPEALNNSGLVLRARGKNAEARESWQSALRIDAKYAPAWVNLGELAADEHALRDAEAAFAKALALKPKLASALLGMARARRDSGRLPEAVTTYRDLVTAQPRHARAWFELAEVLERQADLRGAAEAAQKASELGPDSSEFLFKRADMLAKLGELTRAKAAFEELIDGSPAHEEGRLGLAALLHRMGDDAGCQREAERIVGSATSAQRARKLIALCSQN